MAKNDTGTAANTVRTQVTTYVVLQDITGNEPGTHEEVWAVLGSTEAINGQQAIGRIVPEENLSSGGSYVAVPARSWRPVSPNVQVERRVTWS